MSAHVSAKVYALQRSATGRNVAGDLANLRRAVNAEPGADPAVWEYTLDGLPERYVGRTDAPTAGESAVHAAMTLYAVHQQSKPTSMHKPGVSLGRALALLGRTRSVAAQPDASKAVKRRFDALMTAESFAELTYHARGLIQQLRAADIALDYGRLAEDLRLLQRPATANSVRLRWGRDYAFVPSSPPSDQTNPQTTLEGEEA